MSYTVTQQKHAGCAHMARHVNHRVIPGIIGGWATGYEPLAKPEARAS